MEPAVRQQIADLTPQAREQLEQRLLARRLHAPHGPLAPSDYSASYPLPGTLLSLFLLSLLHPASAAYNEAKALRITGALDLVRLKRVLDAIVERHEILRTIFVVQDKVPTALPCPSVGIEIAVEDLSTVAEDRRDPMLKLSIAETTRRPFDLSKDSMLRVGLFKLQEEEHLLLLVTHHIVSDAYSRDIIFREIVALYRAFSEGKASPLDPLPIQYRDFVSWRQGQLTTDALNRRLSYWNLQLKDVAAALDLPYDYPRPNTPTFRGASEIINLPDSLAERLREISRKQGVTLFMTLLAAFQILLARYSRQERFVVASPFTLRDRVELENLVGYFVSPLLLRADLTGNPTFLEFLARAREAVIGAYSHADVPFGRLIQEQVLERSHGFDPGFQVMFALQGEFLNPMLASEITFTPVKVDSGTAKFDLTLAITPVSETLRGTISYNADLFKPETVRCMADAFVNLLEEIAENPAQPVAALPILSPAQRHKLLIEWNRTEKAFEENLCAQELIEAQAKRTPHAIALEYGQETLSYGELNRRANQLARLLQRHGVEQEARVGISMRCCPNLIIAMLAVLKAGAAYVPMDPHLPRARLQLMADDNRISVILTAKEFLQQFDRGEINILCLDTDGGEFFDESQDDLKTNAKPDGLAYVIYTSGSTGVPNGVEISHRALVNFTSFTADNLNLTPTDRVLQFAPFSFDTAVEEIFPCLSRGATLVLPIEPNIESPGFFLQRVAHSRVSILDLPTAYWHELVAELATGNAALPACVRGVIIGGEKAHPERIIDWFRCVSNDVRLLNTYGPTESTVVATVCELSESLVTSGTDVNAVGRPISNVKAYILDRFMNPLPPGVPGELHLAGISLARGYANRPQLTAEKFIPNPFTNAPGDRLYKTGDMARYTSDGQIVFIGRMDDQIKIRGIRVELGEIESALMGHSAVREAAVLLTSEGAGENRLTAYVSFKSGQSATTNALRNFLKEQIPDYMVPTTCVFLDALPLTLSGKLDRKALPPPDGALAVSEEVHTAPRNDVEHRLGRIWQEILGVRLVDVKDNFFDLGGDSLLAIKLFSEIEKITGRKLPLSILFRAPTLEQLAGIVQVEADAALYASLVPIHPSGSKPPCFLVHGGNGSVLYFADLARHMDPDQPLYALQSPGIDGEVAPLTQIKTIAAHYIEEIRHVQPNGPYILVGLCMGGTVVFEMAQQLLTKGQTVALLILVESFRPDRTGHLGYFIRRMHQKFDQGVVERFTHHAHNLNKLGYRDRATYLQDKLHLVTNNIAAKLSSRKSVGAAEPMPGHRREVTVANMRAMRGYRAKPYTGRLTLFLAHDSPIEGRRDRRLAWGKLATDGMDIQTIPGNHTNMVWDPQAQGLAAKLTDCLNQALTK